MLVDTIQFYRQYICCRGSYIGTFASGMMTRLYCILKQLLAPVTPYNLDRKDKKLCQVRNRFAIPLSYSPLHFHSCFHAPKGPAPLLSWPLGKSVKKHRSRRRTFTELHGKGKLFARVCALLQRMQFPSPMCQSAFDGLLLHLFLPSDRLYCSTPPLSRDKSLSPLATLSKRIPLTSDEKMSLKARKKQDEIRYYTVPTYVNIIDARR